jgi:hypothetical protein
VDKNDQLTVKEKKRLMSSLIVFLMPQDFKRPGIPRRPEAGKLLLAAGKNKLKLITTPVINEVNRHLNKLKLTSKTDRLPQKN